MKPSHKHTSRIFVFVLVWPHLALIGSGTSQRDDLVLPMARSPQITFPPLEPIYQKKYACGMAYQGGLLYCAIVFGICLYHKLGSPGWTQPPELQPNFARQHAGCTVFNGVMWITGGALNDGKH